MKLARFTLKNLQSYGAVVGKTAIFLPDLAQQMQEQLPPTLEEFITAGQETLGTAEALLSRAQAHGLSTFSVPLTKIQLLAPIASPPKIVCLGLNYASHVTETKAQRPNEPVLFMKPHTAIAGPGDKILKRPFVHELDYEGELAIVMGKTAKDIPVSEALHYIFGYTVLNDVSARDFQFKGGQWTPGKSFDTFAPTGPCITTRQQLPNPSNLRVRTWVNDELRQDGNTHDMIFSVAEIVHHLSRIMTLEPCDVIATGTPSGVAMAMKPQKWLQNGDVVRIEIEGIGTLENEIREA